MLSIISGNKLLLLVLIVLSLRNIIRNHKIVKLYRLLLLILISKVINSLFNDVKGLFTHPTVLCHPQFVMNGNISMDPQKLLNLNGQVYPV